MAVIITGARALELKFDTFPDDLRDSLATTITQFVEQLATDVELRRPVTPGKTGMLRSEIKARVFNSKNRIAGYVSVYAPGNSGEYAKAATLEYGSSKARRVFKVGRLSSLLTNSKRRMVSRMTKPVHIEAYRYLRGPFDDTADGLNAALTQVVDEVVSR